MVVVAGWASGCSARERRLLDELRERMGDCLAAHRVAVVSTAGSVGSWAMPVRYRASGLEVDLLIPRWADVVFHLEQDPRVVLVVMGGNNGRLRWLESRGVASPVPQPDWAGLLPETEPRSQASWLYVVFHVTPSRIDLFDESEGWGRRETLDC